MVIARSTGLRFLCRSLSELGGRSPRPLRRSRPAAVLVPLISQLLHVGVDFGFQGGGQHAPRPFVDGLVDQEAVQGGAVRVLRGTLPEADPQVLSIPLPSGPGLDSNSVSSSNAPRLTQPEPPQPIHRA
ncbi:hypothetical protein ACSCBZ_18285 [Streptomyces niveiscabiei]|uniref:hypothetical protein n=1 Tax=Streptomyces niveiscabiei TaxID=164115 RepID=UPI000A9881A3